MAQSTGMLFDFRAGGEGGGGGVRVILGSETWVACLARDCYLLVQVWFALVGQLLAAARIVKL